MKKIDKADMQPVMPIRRGKTTKLRAMLLSLEIGEGLFLPKEEWKRKNGPFYVVSYIKKTHGFRYEYGLKADGSGWLFRRVK